MAAIIPDNPLAPIIEAENALGARVLTIDIETADSDKKGIDLAKKYWKPPANMNDPETMKSKHGESTTAFDKRLKAARTNMDIRKKEAFAKIEERAALLDGAPVAVVSVRTESEMAVFYLKKYAKKAFKKLKGIDCPLFGYKSEKEMLIGVRTWMDTRALPTTVVVGQNIYGFDLPKLRGAYVRNRVGLPKLIHPDAKDVGVRVFDIMHKFRYFSREYSDAKFVKLEVILDYLGLPVHKGSMKGADVPAALKAGKVQQVASYCLLDTLGTYEAFLILSGKFQDEHDK